MSSYKNTLRAEKRKFYLIFEAPTLRAVFNCACSRCGSGFLTCHLFIFVYILVPLLPPCPWFSMSIGRGKIIVEFFSAAMVLNVCRYLSCSATGDSAITLAASFRALEALCSPSAAMTLALASRPASASAAMARCSCTGRRTSLLKYNSRSFKKISISATESLNHN